MSVSYTYQRMTIGDVCILHVPTTSQFADIFTKDLTTSLFLKFQSSLNIRSGYNFDYMGVLENVLYYKYIGPKPPTALDLVQPMRAPPWWHLYTIRVCPSTPP
jgi:hypothetical protein